MNGNKLKFVTHFIVALLLCATLQASSKCDFSGDGIVNLKDYVEFSRTWGACLPWGPSGSPPQLIAHWRLDNNAQDSQSEFHGEVFGDPIWLTGNNAVVGSGAIRMDGQDNIQIEYDDFPVFNNSFAIDVWIKTNGSGLDQVIVSKGNSSWQLGIDGATGAVFFSCPGLTGTNYLLGQSDLTDNQWYQITGVYDQQLQKIIIYKDGSIDAESTASGSVENDDSGIWIGGDPESPESRKWWYGDVDNIRIFNYAPTQYEIFQRKVYHVDQAQGNNGNSGMGKQNAFKTIQMAIDTADDGDAIWVWPGIYQEDVYIWDSEKLLTIKSISDAAVIKAPPDEYAVSFISGTTGAIFENFVICDSEIGIFIESSSPVLRYLTVVNNDYGIVAYSTLNPANPQIDHCILWDNIQDDVYNSDYTPDITYSCIERLASGQGNFSSDPLFADPNNMDYHLQSETGRYFSQDPNNHNPGPENWTIDGQTSPCIDAGDETLNPMRESMPNGGRMNIGAYGNTKYASKSPWPCPADLSLNGQVEWEDFCEFLEHWLYSEPEYITKGKDL